MQKVTVEWLRSVDVFEGVPADQLQWMIDNSNCLTTTEGEHFFHAGDPVLGAYIIISGRIKLYVVRQNEISEIGILEPKAVSGALPFSRATKITVNAKVLESGGVMVLPTEKFRELVATHYELTAAFVHVMTDRVRNFTSLQQQNEKMMALGKLSAGLAHELNNPAAAIVRGSETLKEHLALEPEAFKEVMNIRMDPRDVDFVKDKLFEILGRKEKPKITLVQRTQLADEMREWMDEHKILNSDEITENFLDYCFSCEDMEAFQEHIPDEFLSPVFNWVSSNLVTERMIQDIYDASQRIFSLIQSVKNFTHMDQGKGMEFIDIHSGIASTLTMMQYKLRKGNIEVVKEFDDHLPKVKALAGELNQVWTNLIDNAVDAMAVNGRGQLTIRTQKDHSFARVSIIDNGTGIPEDIQSSIFDPFFTTKDIGKGTGLGLDMVQRIVKGQHHGSVKVNSIPGHTEFVVCLPIH
jgi:signal transduction histidine kinase